YLVFQKIDGILRIPIPGVGFIITIIIITIIGFLSSNFITRRLVRYFERIFSKLPLVKIVYSSIKDLVGAFVGDKKSFDKPVLVVIHPETKVRALGFITRESLEFLKLREHVAVYFPQSYNFAGNLLIFPNEMVEAIEANSSEVMKFLVSGGVSGGSSDQSGKKGG
ncbi:MAG: DUF502 domain-containing protein, partial [Thermodesulfobacteriota bacterium]